MTRVAADFGVPPEQIRKDLAVLWMCGLPGLTPEKMIDVDMESIEEDPEGVVRIDNAEYLSRPVRLGSSEASALIVALRALRETNPELPNEAIDRALAKLEEAAATGTETPAVALHLPPRTRRPRRQPPCARRSRPTARPASTTTCRPGTRRRSARSTPWSCSPATATTTSTPGATSPRPAGSSGSTGCTT